MGEWPPRDGKCPHAKENIPTEEIILQYQFSNLTKFPKNMANTTKMCIKTNMKIIKFSKCSSAGKIAVEPPPPEKPLPGEPPSEKISPEKKHLNFFWTILCPGPEHNTNYNPALTLTLTLTLMLTLTLALILRCWENRKCGILFVKM